ncbi:hypothetical protein [Haloglomus salinum]|uniref:hypothetical protein n=1 Tax=Haloglomus salinum TaxID=2962673 RepID=UPI0020C97761|nr:hypothetical protein [Haloglomus salinum]
MKSAQTREVAKERTSTPRKSVLFCPTCGRRAPVEGDWVVTERSVDGDCRRAYGCPACGRTLVDQPVFEASIPA